MTHNEIYTKFMIEYDKANVTSSYPSLTPIEIATILNKAYLALIALKVTGNNPRQATFESDSKAISDIQPLVVTATSNPSGQHPSATNSKQYNLPNEFLYYISGVVDLFGNKAPVTLLSHENALKFKLTISNRPWIKNAVAYIEDDKIIVLYDNVDNMNHNAGDPGTFYVTYVKQPAEFSVNTMRSESTVDIEVNDTMAEELISLAVMMALENVESTRLQTKAQMRGLEA